MNLSPAQNKMIARLKDGHRIGYGRLWYRFVNNDWRCFGGKANDATIDALIARGVLVEIGLQTDVNYDVRLAETAPVAVETITPDATVAAPADSTPDTDTPTATLRPATIFLPFIAPNKAMRKRVHNYIKTLPGFMCFDGGDAWITDHSLGCMAYFANVTYAGAAIFDIQCNPAEYGATEAIYHIYIDVCYEATDRDVYDAAVVAFAHTPSATNYVNLHAAMLAYQASHPINAEYTQR